MSVSINNLFHRSSTCYFFHKKREFCGRLSLTGMFFFFFLWCRSISSSTVSFLIEIAVLGLRSLTGSSGNHMCPLGRSPILAMWLLLTSRSYETSPSSWPVTAQLPHEQLIQKKKEQNYARVREVVWRLHNGHEEAIYRLIDSKKRKMKAFDRAKRRKEHARSLSFSFLRTIRADIIDGFFKRLSVII